MRRAVAARGVAAGPENDSTEKPIISILIAAAEAAAAAAAENVARRAWEGERERCTERGPHCPHTRTVTKV